MAPNLPAWAKQAQAKWTYRGQRRPPFAHTPQPGRESVWDYPRPPRLEKDARRIVLKIQRKTIVNCNESFRILETASPPTFYIPSTAIDPTLLVTHPHSSACEWKGVAQYWSLSVGDGYLEEVAWSYPEPFPGYEPIAGYLSFYPNRVECWVDDIRVIPQPGGLYGGWVTPDLVGPFKGESGTENW